LTNKREKYKIKSNAKVNLALRITDKLDNGYHTLSTIFQEIDLHDTIIFSPSEKFNFSSDDKSLPIDSRNLCVSAYELMKAKAGKINDWSIYLEKVIPMGAGLGGGSSNAATVIKFLNEVWNLDYSNKKLKEIGLQLGCDVPFYIEGKTQGATGVGEKLEKLDFPSNYWILLVCPSIHISTVWAYKNFSLTNKKKNYTFGSLIENEEIQWQLFENQFETIVFQSYPEIRNIKDMLSKEGAKYSGLSGSGSTVIGIFSKEQEAIKAQSVFSKYPTFISLPVR